MSNRARVFRLAVRLVITGLLAGAAAGADAIVFTNDYDQVTVLPALTNNPGDQDWRAHGAVTPVKNEGSCDASWVFAATGLVEADHFFRKGTLVNLSEQELLDCTDSGSDCGGGSPVAALRTVIARGGLTPTFTYPYTARLGTCKTFTPVATIPGAGRVPPGDEVSLQNYVAQAPVLALVDASPSFETYHGGIFTGPCSDTNPPTRAVLIVGYTADYWIVKNSQGASWGASGYIYMARHLNICGIANFALAVANDPLPPPVVAIPIVGPWAVGVLVFGLAAIGLLTLRRQIG